jgi:H+/Cl- antiporter ClcA
MLVIRVKKRLDTARFSIPAIAFIAGIAIAITGYISNGATFGTGYLETRMILQGNAEIDPSFPFLKMLATFATFVSGVPSGIFVPSLAAGASLGVDLANWFPIAPPTAMILLTMTAYFSGMLQSPITSFVIVMEITDTHEMVIPFMAVALFATGTSKLVCPVPLYRALCDTYSVTEENTNVEKEDV